MTNYIKPGSQAPFKNSSASVTKTLDILTKFLTILSMKKKYQFSTVIQQGHCI